MADKHEKNEDTKKLLVEGQRHTMRIWEKATTPQWQMLIIFHFCLIEVIIKFTIVETEQRHRDNGFQKTTA